MIEIADQFDLEQMVNEPTHQDRILDLFLNNHPTQVQKSVVIPGISDRDGIPMIDMLIHPLIKTKPRKIYRFNKTDIESLKQASSPKSRVTKTQPLRLIGLILKMVSLISWTHTFPLNTVPRKIVLLG